jgi:hypothetical protein
MSDGAALIMKGESRPLIFISHIAEEKELAEALKGAIEASFPGGLTVFVSSDRESIPKGREWFDSIKRSLETARAMLVMCSASSVRQQWISFEAGACWIRGMPVTPLCHTGMTPDMLPAPLSLLQGTCLCDGWEGVLAQLATVASVDRKVLPQDAFLAKAKELESRYFFWNRCNEGLSYLAKWEQTNIDRLRQGVRIQLSLSDKRANVLEGYVEFFRKHDVLEIRQTGTTIGPCAKIYCITPLQRLNEVLKSPLFQVVEVEE